MITVPTLNLFGSIHGTEAFKGSNSGDQPAMLELSKFDVGTGNSYARGFWTFYYDAVYRCNLILKLLPDATDMSAARKTQVEAETKFLRAHYYFMLKINFKNIPWIDETTEDVRQPNDVDVWPQIAADMNFARQNLPDEQVDLGRPNSWAAQHIMPKY